MLIHMLHKNSDCVLLREEGLYPRNIGVNRPEAQFKDLCIRVSASNQIRECVHELISICAWARIEGGALR